MKNAAVNYVIACWSGPRRGKTPFFDQDDLYYIQNHIESLKKLQHNVNQITVVVPFNPYQSDRYTQYLDSLPSKIGSADVVIIHRENYGQSYGSYSHVYDNYRDQFDYYIFIEDDYIFVQNHFDEILVSEYQARNNCGYLCSLILNSHGGPHAALSNGIVHHSVLAKVWDAYGKIPHEHIRRGGYDTGPQLSFSAGFPAIGTKLCDVTSIFRAPYNHLGTLSVHANHNHYDLIVPVQFKDYLKNTLAPPPETKIQILLLYYNRPNMVKNALNSIKDSNYTNWELTFIDDGSSKPGKHIARDLLVDHLDRIKFYNSGHSPEDKQKQGGSHLGQLMNTAMEDSDAEICIMLCDDDALHPDYLCNLNSWFQMHSHQMYCYSHVILFDPFKEDYSNLDMSSPIFVPSLQVQSDRIRNFWNKTGNINCTNQVDASQVAWRRSVEARFPWPRTKNLDATFYSKLCEHYGTALFTGFISQYKGIYSDALDTRSDIYHPKDL